MKNKNDVQAMLKEAGILFAITLIAGLLLGFVYELTKEPIRLQEEFMRSGKGYLLLRYSKLLILHTGFMIIIEKMPMEKGENCIRP